MEAGFCIVVSEIRQSQTEGSQECWFYGGRKTYCVGLIYRRILHLHKDKSHPPEGLYRSHEGIFDHICQHCECFGEYVPAPPSRSECKCWDQSGSGMSDDNVLMNPQFRLFCDVWRCKGVEKSRLSVGGINWIDKCNIEKNLFLRCSL